MPPMGLSGKKIAAAAPAATEFVAYTTDQVGSGDSTINLAKPTGTVEGDLMIFFWLGAGGFSSSIDTSPSGWNQKHNGSQALDGVNAYEVCQTKVAGGSEPGSYVWSLNGGSDHGLGCILTYRPAHAVQVDIIAGSIMGNPSASHTPPNVTTVQDNARIIVAYMLNRSGLSSAYISVDPTGMTERLTVNGGPISRSDLVMEIFEEDTIVSPAGLYTAKAATAGTSDHYGYGITVGIRALGT